MIELLDVDSAAQQLEAVIWRTIVIGDDNRSLAHKFQDADNQVYNNIRLPIINALKNGGDML